MPKLSEIESFLESQTQGDYPSKAAVEVKAQWLIDNARYTRNVIFKMRGVGKTTWNNFLWAFGLEETITLKRK